MNLASLFFHPVAKGLWGGLASACLAGLLLLLASAGCCCCIWVLASSSGSQDSSCQSCQLCSTWVALLAVWEVALLAAWEVALLAAWAWRLSVALLSVWEVPWVVSSAAGMMQWLAWLVWQAASCLPTSLVLAMPVLVEDLLCACSGAAAFWHLQR